MEKPVMSHMEKKMGAFISIYSLQSSLLLDGLSPAIINTITP